MRWPLALVSSLPLKPSRLRQIVYNLSNRAKTNPMTAPFATMIESGFNTVYRMPPEVIRILQRPLEQIAGAGRRIVQGFSELLQSRVATLTQIMRVVRQTVVPMWEDLSLEAVTNIRATLMRQQSSSSENSDNGKEGQVMIGKKKENVKWE